MKKSSWVLLICLAFLNIGTVLYAFGDGNSPWLVSMKKSDATRSQLIETLQQGIMNEYGKRTSLPEDMESLDFYFKKLNIDPVTGEKFEYIKVSEREFNLCAVFSLDSKDETKRGQYSKVNTYIHPAGKYCFSYVI